MNRLLTTLFIICITLLVACSDNNGNDIKNRNEVDHEDELNENNELDDEQSNLSNNENIDSSDKAEDQQDLKIGDTGKFDTTLGSYEITLEHAQFVGEELDGVRTQLENLLLIDITIKNTSDQTLLAENLIGALTVSNEMDETGFYNIAKEFESVEYFKPGEVRSSQYIVEVYNDEKYYFREDSGTVAAGLSNQVAWLITREELHD